VSSKNQEASHYAVFSSLLLLPPTLAQRSPSTPYSRTPSAWLFP